MPGFDHLPLKAAKALHIEDAPASVKARLLARQRDLGFVDLAWTPVDGGFEMRRIGPNEQHGCHGTDAISLEQFADGDIVYRRAGNTTCIKEKHLEDWRATGRDTWPLLTGVSLPPMRSTYNQDPTTDGIRVPAAALARFHSIAAADEAHSDATHFVITDIEDTRFNMITRSGRANSDGVMELTRRIKGAGGDGLYYFDGRLAVGRDNMHHILDMLHNDHNLVATMYAVRPPGYELSDDPADKIVLYYGKANHPPTHTTDGRLIGR